jgi:hypothetical protein
MFLRNGTSRNVNPDNPHISHRRHCHEQLPLIPVVTKEEKADPEIPGSRWVPMDPIESRDPMDPMRSNSIHWDSEISGSAFFPWSSQRSDEEL